MRPIKTTGIIIKSTLHKENNKILSLFTPNLGVIKIYTKGSRKTNYLKEALFTPLCESEFVLFEGQREFYFFKEGALIDQHLKLRQQAPLLKAATTITLALQHSQWLGKPAAPLYTLYSTTLKTIPTFSPLHTLTATFLLKLLYYEGTWALSSKCTHCQTPLQETLRYGGQMFCHNHAPNGALSFTSLQEQTLQTLVQARSFEALSKVPLAQELSEPIATLFEQATQES